jgi:hypothetical protein
VTTPPDRRIEPPATGGGQPVTDADEVARLRAEIAAWRSQLERGGWRRRLATDARRTAAALLIMVAALSVTAGLAAV